MQANPKKGIARAYTAMAAAWDAVIFLGAKAALIALFAPPLVFVYLVSGHFVTRAVKTFRSRQTKNK
jgi:hypothetical protein